VLRLDFSHLGDTDFEEFCYRLLHELGFVNLDWRKGTGKKASPADRGRDIAASWERVDVDGTKHLDRWFAECKHHAKGVAPEKLQGLLAWAEAESPRTALIIASGFLSNPAKDYLASYRQTRRPPFDIKHWERPDLERMLVDHPELISDFGLLGSSLRPEDDIMAAEQEFFDKVWYGRHKLREEKLRRILSGDEKDDHPYPITPDIARGALEAGVKTRERYGGEENVLPESDFDWRMSGKLSALRWVLGDDWDMLDT
jgi:hypothetical protein